jgi:hypothetical protein
MLSIMVNGGVIAQTIGAVRVAGFRGIHVGLWKGLRSDYGIFKCD